jgi:hypothetical protein
MPRLFQGRQNGETIVDSLRNRVQQVRQTGLMPTIRSRLEQTAARTGATQRPGLFERDVPTQGGGTQDNDRGI